jgi:hypothetical protein
VAGPCFAPSGTTPAHATARGHATRQLCAALDTYGPADLA